MAQHPAIACINRLPYELLSHIFDQPDVPNESLYNISITSKRMHYFSLPIFLARFNILDPTRYAEIIFGDEPQSTVDALSGLKVALFVPSIKQLVCRFQLTSHAMEYHTVIRHMRRVHNLVSSLEMVEGVKLIMGNDHCGCCLESLSGDMLDAALKEWSTTIGRTWSKIIEKKCLSLAIVGGRYMGHTYSFRLGNNPEKNAGPFIGFKNILTKKQSDVTLRLEEDAIDMLRGRNWRFQRAAGTGTAVILTPLSSAAREHGILRSLTITSTIMIVPPVLHWVVSALRLPSMKTLHIKNISVNRKCWHAVFSVIAQHAPHLTEIRLSCIRQIIPADLLNFLSGLSKLEILHLGRSVDCLDTFDMCKFPDFPDLQLLHAPAAWVFKLLSAQRKGLPKLQKLSIVYSMRNDGLSHWLRWSSLPSIPVLLKEQQRSLVILLRIHLGVSPGWKMLEDVENAPESQMSFDQSELGNVAALTLVFDEDLDSDDIPLAEVLPRWLALFFNLRILTIKTRYLSGSASRSQNDIVTELIAGILKEGGLAEISSVEVDGLMVTSSGVLAKEG